ncbi:DEKNAAC102297 [Brettanomyces naardenensis]|uniref:Protein BIG1 n=1 Tax=Brettanomyces naardenensis TaxID=13370 RepID=A0A448YKV1_BRENA|nr:DEKNAAC102297 [Brettanomyces naardenensis]
MPFGLDEAELLISRSLEECLSHAYIIAVVPGLKIEDFSNFDVFENVRDMMTKSSTVLSMPNILSDGSGTTLGIEQFENILKVHCNAKEITVNGVDEGQVPYYIDTRTRLIRVDFPPLGNTSEARRERLRNYDLMIKKISRELPSPNIAVLFTTNTTSEADMNDIADEKEIIKENEIPDNPKILNVNLRGKIRSSRRMIFPDITVFDKSRYYEWERNKKRGLEDASKETERAREDETWLKKKKKKIVKSSSLYRFGEDGKDVTSALFNRDFLHDNALLILCVLSLFFMIIFFDTLKLLISMMMVLFSRQKKTKKKKKKEE